MVRMRVEAMQYYPKALTTANHHRAEQDIAQIFPFPTELVALLTGKALHFATMETVA